ncbi:MAG: glutamine-hydrolyzing GMP synthase [Acidiferrobacteraceae bacterium]
MTGTPAPSVPGDFPANDPYSQRILILDFGSQYTQLIARRVREAGVYCEIHPWDTNAEALRVFAPRGVILSGGPESVVKDDAPRIPEVIFGLRVPVLGICYGMQSLSAQFGGRVETALRREYGHARVEVSPDNRLLNGLVGPGEQGLDVWMSHGDRVIELPPGFCAIAYTESAPLAGIADESRGFYGLQFHPEVTHTRHGQEIIERFVHDICRCDRLWTPTRIIDSLIENVRHQVGGGRVLLGLSGGVDSSVVAALLHRAIGTQLTCIFVDNGLLRQNEAQEVQEVFARHMGVALLYSRSAERFLDALAGVSDPEHKRKIIGQMFIKVFEEEAAQITDVRWLAQGTIYPDVIESAGAKTGKARIIKSHHNVGGLPETMRLQLLEPLRDLFKDEVRQIGIELGLPRELVFRHPFPGPGLGVRVLGEVKREYVQTLRQADAIYIEELRRHGWYDRVSQAFAVFLPVRSVGVVGDERAYEHVIALRAVETVDFMTANWARLPYELLGIVSHRIINEIRGVSRVVYDISGKPPATIEWE